MTVVVLGLMGSGKSTAAAYLAERLAWTVDDSDASITAATGRTAKELVIAHGVEHLHRLEAEHVLTGTAGGGPAVIAAAASVVDDPDVRTALAARPVVWLHARPEVLAERFATGPHRPRYDPDLLTMLQRMADRRAAWFRSVATWVIDADRPVADVCRQLDPVVDALRAPAPSPTPVSTGGPLP